jgi:hypothetical protein
MKKNILSKLLISALIFFLFSSCASTKCECETKNKYSKRKSSFSLFDCQKNATFARQKDKMSQESVFL